MSQLAMRNIHDSQLKKAKRLSCKVVASQIVLALLLFVIVNPPLCFAAFDHTHTAFSKELKKYVQSSGVNYAKWKKHPEGLYNYVSSLSKISAEDYLAFSSAQKKALWLNAYNALAIKLVLDHYPICGKLSYYPSDSIRQIPDVWESVKTTVAGREVTLYKMEHCVLRKELHDCRTHFVVVPAAKGGAKLLSQAFNADLVEEELNQGQKTFFSDPSHLFFDQNKNTLTVSQIFKWFPLDFQHNDLKSKVPFLPLSDDQIVRDYVIRFLPSEIAEKLATKEVKVEYAPYNWALNEAN